MDETLLELQRIHQATNWVLLGIALLDFMGLVMTCWVFYLARGTKASVNRVAEIQNQVSYYLFGKLGPLEIK
ncbi:MAG TPA: hypothetical protein VLF14_06615 [Candidatus Binatia bacterium]|nr:hypothetical protein [Candidatus Binatia bacterium]